MKNTQNMQRLRRGELTRMNSRAAPHTDVFMGAAPDQPKKTDDTLEALQVQVSTLKKEKNELEHALKKAEDTLANYNEKAEDTLANYNEDAYTKLEQELEETQAEVAKLTADRVALERQLNEQAQPVKGVRILKVTAVSTNDDGLMRVDCELKPTDGPLGSTAAVIIPAEEVSKLSEEVENEEDDDDEG